MAFHPDGWTSYDGDGGVSWNAAGDVTITGNGSDDAYIEQTLTTVAGRRYQVEVVTISHSGTATVTIAGTPTRSFEAVGARVVCVSFLAAGTSTTLRVGITAGQTGTLQISSVQCFEQFRINSLSEILRFVAERAGVSSSVIDLDACEAIETETPYELAFHTSTEVNGDQLAIMAARSYGCGLFQDRFGKLKPVRLQAPAVTADFDIAEWQVVGGVLPEPDNAPGLSNRMSYGRNYAIHSDEDATNADATTRAELMREVRVVTSTETLHSNYSEAAEREPIETLLSEEADAQDEIDRLCALYTVPRTFYTFKVRTDDTVDPLLIEPGHTVNLTWPRFGMGSGKNLLVILARSSLQGGAVDLVCWG